MSSERPEHDTARPRRRRSPAAITSVAAAVLLAGGGGAYWAATAAGHDNGGTETSGAPTGTTDPPPLALDQSARSSGSPGIAPGEPDPRGTVYRPAGTFPDPPKTAPVYRADGTVSAADVAKLADALGVPGTPRLVGTDWKVGAAKDGSGPLLQVARQAPGTWTYTRFGSGGGDNCPQGKECSTGGTASAGGGKAVSERAAKAAAAPLLKALGESDAKLDAGRVMGSVRVVNAEPKIGGLPTSGWTTGLQVGADGRLTGGSGPLKAPVKGAEYPLISAADALKRLNTPAAGAPGAGSGGCATMEPLTERSAAGTGKSAASSSAGTTAGRASAPPSASCAPSSPPKAPESRQVTVSHAELGLAVRLAGGRQILVPSWLFGTRPEGTTGPATVTATAVADRYLAKPEPPADGNRPGGSDQTPTAYRADGRTLTLRIMGRVCGRYGVRTTENKDTVRLALSAPSPKPGTVCPDIIGAVTQKVVLEQPLGSRQVVNAANGDPVPRM
ncbi:hypothetical protein OG760_08370 [Streptomyces sp. NBC_00963]|uniref:hypothetical protein n=1 Tax=unclassified Streptomyces TaxID=2593676 RepID=UPI002258F60E|nr:hypothetical protein [Streptomyces sp. NBC_01306]MCX4727062.1 hypothetical protein [Streptomyces sp. NBC_01306]WSX41722.1 hypothetical protein OG760_08370 [Streptomyces sp. NBC_00963]